MQKLLVGVSALTLGLALCGAAMAQDTTTSNGAGSSAANDGATSTTVDGNNLLSGNFSNDGSKNTVGSGNSKTNAAVAGSGGAANNGSTVNSGSSDGNTNVAVNISKTHTDVTTTVVELLGPVTLQSLSGEVSETAAFGLGDGSGLSTGSISNTGGTSASFAGVQTQTNSTGIQNVNQSSTAVAASASITF
jgi:hypothetical protein